MKPVEPTPFKDRDLAAGAAARDVVHPARITMALDACGLDGPGVDEALGVEEPTVDRWEDGEIPPTREDVGRLAALTGFPPAWFYAGPIPAIGPGLMCGEDGCGVIPDQGYPNPWAKVLPFSPRM